MGRTRFTALMAVLVLIIAGAVIKGAVSRVATGSVTPSQKPETKTLIVKMAKGLTLAQARAVVNTHGGTPKSSVPKLDLQIIEVPAVAADAIAKSLQGDAAVVRVEENLTRKWQSAPSDTYYDNQWALPKVAWDQVYGAVSPQFLTTVAILDTGVDSSHPDLIGSIGPGASMIDDSNGMTDVNGHGTWLAGIVAARTDNLQGMSGVAFDHVQVMPVKVLDADGLGQDSDIIAGVVWAADNGASVILMAFSNTGFSQSLQDAIDYAWDKNVVLVAAAGNDGSSTATFPAGDKSVIGVSATDPNDNLANTSNFGSSVFLAAPGVDILGTYKDQGYVTWSGTSGSAAMVAGTAALMRAVDPSLANGVIVNRIARTADPAGTQDQTGNGRLNIARAVADTTTDAIQPAGAAPLGNGGPFVGPYKVAATGDGSGTLSVSPTTAVAGSTGNNFQFVFTVGATTFSNSGSITIALPSGGWSSFTSGNVSIASDTCAGTPTRGVTTSLITITTGGGCNLGQTITINYSSVTAGTTLGANTFQAQSKVGGTGSNLANLSTSPSVTLTAPVASKLVFTSVNSGANVTSGTPFNVVVQSQSTSGLPANVTADTAVTLTVDTGAGVLGGTVSGTIAAGTNSVTISGVTYTNAAGETGAKLLASDDTLSAGTSAAFTVVGAANKLAFTTSPANSAAGAAFGAVVKVQDSIGNTVTGDTSGVTLSITSGTPTSGGPGTLSGTVTVNAVGGVATFSGLSITTAGTGYKLHAVDGSLAAADSTAFNITAAGANKLVFTTSPGDSATSVPFLTQPAVTVQDTYGNTVTGSTASITLSITSGTGTAGAALSCSGGLSKTATAGIATFSGCQINMPGAAYGLHATSSGLTAADSASFNINNPVPATTGISPASKPKNDPGFALTVNGSNFNSSSTVYFNGSPRATTFVSVAQLSATILSTDLSTLGNFPITVVNPAPGGGVSNPQTFAVTRSTSTSLVCVPSSVTQGAGVTCTATVTDTAGEGTTPPDGIVNFSTLGGGTFSPTSCTLAPFSSNSKSCTVSYATSTGGSQTLTANYAGNATHGSSSGTFFLDVLTTCSSFSTKLEGQSAGSTAWIAGNLQGWKELDYVPSRVRFCGGPVASQTIVLTFPHTKTTGGTVKRGIEDLFHFSTSTGVTFTSAPALTSSSGDDWSYTFTFSSTASVGYIYFEPRLSSGVHDFGGSSLAISGSPSSMGNLQIAKPNVKTDNGTPILTLTKDGPSTAAQDDSFAYTLTYANIATSGPAGSPPGFNSATGVQVTDALPPNVTVTSVTCDPATPTCPRLSGNGSTLTWDIGTVAPGASGSVSFTVHVSATAPLGDITNTGYENSAETTQVQASKTTTINASCTSLAVATQPSNQTITYGQNATFTAAVTGSAPTVQWQQNTGAGFTNIPGATSATLNVVLPTVSQTGTQYRAVFTNSCSTVTSNSATLTVNKATPTITWNNPAAITYGTALSNTQLNATASVAGDSFVYTPGSGTILNAGSGQTLHVLFTPTDTNNYNTASKDVTIDVGKANPVITVTPYSVTYDGNAHTATGTATGVAGADLSAGLHLSATTHTNAGTYAGDTWTFTDNTGNYNNASGTVSDSIAKANADINVTAYSVTYDGNPHTATGTATGVSSTDLSAGLNLSGTTHTNAGTYNGDAWTFTDAAGNYNNASGTVNDTIAKANAVITVTPYNVTYDGNAHTATGSATGVAGADLSAGLKLSGTTHTSAGTYNSDSWTFTDAAGNYNDATGTVDDSIAKANADITVTAYSLTYDGNPHTASGTATGVGGAILTAGLNLSGTTHTNAGTYNSDSWTFTDAAGNYNDATGTVKDTIAKANANITVTAYSTTYDGHAHTATGTATGVGGADLNAGLNLSGTTHTNAGTYSTDAWTFTDTAGNYNDASGTVNDTIAKANANITVTPYSTTYNGNPHTATGTTTGVGGADLSAGLNLSGTTHTAAGSYSADAWTFTDASGNYNDANGTVNDSIGKANAVIVVTAYNVSYDGHAHTATGTATGVGGADLSVGLNLSGTTHTNAGIYTADTWTFTDTSGNYNNAGGTVNDSIGKANAVIAVTPYSVSYDGLPHTATGTATGVGNADLSAGLNLSGTTHTAAGSYTGDVWTFTDPAGNYNSANGTINDSIGKANAVIVVTPYSVSYDGSAHTATGAATGLGGLDLSAGLNLSGTTHTAAGNYTGDAWTFTDPAGNYNNASGTVNDSIGKANAVIAVHAYSVTYDGLPHTATGTATGLGGVDLSASLNLGGTTHTNAGTYTGDIWSFTDTSGNYNNASGTITDTIGKSNVASIVVTPYSVTYDGLAHKATGIATGAGGADLSAGLNLSGTTHTNAGTYTGDVWTFTDPSGNYNNASGTVNDSISKANVAGITVTPYNVAYDGLPHTATGTATGAGGADLSAGLNLSGTTHTNAGTYTGDAWTFTDAAGNYNSASGTVDDTISKANAPRIVVTPYHVTYNGLAHTATGTATGGAGENLSAGLNLSGTTHTNAGNYSGDVWTFTDPSGNYNSASGTIDDSISKANPTINVTPYSVSYDGLSHTATGTATGAGGADLSAGLNLSGTTHTAAGSYNSDAWTFTDGSGNYNNASGTINDAIGKATAVIVVTPYHVTYDGVAHTAAGTATGLGGLNLSAGLNLSGTTHTSAGTYNLDIWTFTDASGNYNNASGTINDSISKASAANIVVTPYHVTYDGLAHTATGTATGLGGVDLSAGLNLSGTTHTNAGTYNGDVWTFTDPTGNYNNASGTVDDSISKANAASIVITPYSVTYDGLAHMATGTATGLGGVNLSAGLNLSGTTHTNAGTYNGDVWTFTDPSGNYNNASGTVNDSIGKADAAISVTPYTTTYNGLPHTATGVAAGVGGVNLSSGLNLSGTTHTNAGTYTGDIWTFTDPAGNYNEAGGTITDNIGKANAVVNVSGYTGVYDGAAHGATGSATSAGGENLTSLLSFGASFSNVPGGTAHWTFAGNANYSPASGDVAITITPRTLTVRADNKSKTYGDPNPALTASYSGFVNGDTEAVLSGSPVLSTSAAASSPAGNYPIAVTAGTLSAANYSFSFVNGTLAITKAVLTVTAEDKTKVYGSANPAFTFTISGFVNGETLATSGVSGTPALSTTATAASYVGTYAITPATGTLLSASYSFFFANGTLTITPKPASVTPNPATKIYGASDPAFSGTLSGFLAGDNVTATYSRTAGQTVAGSPYTISATLSPSSVLVNYDITYNTAAFTITPKAASVTPTAATKTFGSPDPTLTGTLTGFVASDGVSATYTRTPGETVAGSPYTISATLSPAAVLSNYTITYNTANFTITPRTLTITSLGGTKTYGEVYTFETSFPSDDYTATGLVGTDSIASITLTSTGAAAGALVGAYPIVPSGAVFGSGSPSNYNIQYVNGWLIVGARDGRVAYIGQTLFVTSGSSSTTAQVTLTASVYDPTPGGGTISAATVTFTDLLTSKVLASGVKVSLVPNSTQTGTANTIVTLSTGQYGAQEYLIEVTLGGSFKNDQQTTAPSDSDPYKAAHPVVTVMIPATKNTMQGTGYVDKIPTAAGVLGLGTMSNYTAGFNYNNKGTNTQGKMELIIEQADGTYYIKSNSITSVAFYNPINGLNRDVTVYTKGSIYKIVNGKTIAIDGGVTIRMDAHDGGGSGDTMAFTVLSGKDGTLYYSNNWVYDPVILGWHTVPQTVDTTYAAGGTGTAGAAVVIN